MTSSLAGPSRLVVATCLLASFAGCGASDSLLGSSPEPAVYVVLSREPETYSPPGVPVPDSALYALVVTMGSPERSHYRVAESFNMRRASDGVELAWEAVPRSGAVAPRAGAVLQVEVGNWVLAETRIGSRLGRDSLADGTLYQLEVLTGGRLLTGTAILPGTPAIQFNESALGTVVSWSPAIGAAAYWVIADTDDPAATLTLDTSYVLRRNSPPGLPDPGPRYVRVIAVDVNLNAMLVDTLRYRSGILGGFGVFGATSSARRVIPDAP